MALPALRFPISADMAEFERAMDKTRDVAREATKQVVKNFVDVNGEFRAIAREMAETAAWSAARIAAPYIVAGASIIVAFKAFSAVLANAREDIEAMVKVAEDARDMNVAPDFLQRWRAESRGLQIEVGDLDRALAQSFEATKERSPINVGEWETAGELITEVEKALRVYNVAAKEASGQKLDGLVAFRDASTQEAKVIAVLNAMKQLQALGMNLQALDLGERMFGADFVDKLRTGKTTVDAMLARINEMSAAGPTIFSDEMVRRAKAIDDQLKIAEQRLSDEMRPTLDGLSEKLLDIRKIWADIVGIVADGVALANKFGVGGQTALQQKRSQLSNVQTMLDGGPAFFDFEQRNREALRDKLKAEIAAMEREAADKAPRNTFDQRFGVWPSTSKGEGAAPTKRATEQKASEADPLATRADAIERRTAMLEAEARTMDVGTQARERAKVVAELETVAIQANTAAGRENAAVTDEQRARIEAVADAYAKAQLAIEQARSPLATFARESANLNLALNRFAATALDGMTDQFASIITGTQSVGDAFRNMTASILQDLARLAIRQSITGPLASALSGALGGGGAGGGLLAGLFGGGRASGGGVDAGRVYEVGERGRELFVPPVDGTIVPNFQVGSAMSPNVNLSNQIIVEDRVGARVSTTEESDGRGGRRTRLVLDEMVAGAVGRPGSAANQSVFSALGARQRPRRMGA